jgi:arylformamidase
MMLAADWPALAPDLPPQLLRGGLAVSGVFDLEPIARTPFLRKDLRLGPAAARRVSPVRYTPPRSVPLHTAVGSHESGEFHRQAGLIRAAWPHCAGRHLALEGHNHFTVVEALSDPDSMLHRNALRMMALA